MVLVALCLPQTKGGSEDVSIQMMRQLANTQRGVPAEVLQA